MLPPRLLPALMLCLSALSLTGCGAVVAPQVRAERLEVPDSLLACLPEPQPPGDPVTDADLARWVLALAEAGEDCRGRLGHVRGLVVR